MSTRRRPPKQQPARGSAELGVMVEYLESQFKVVIEAVQGCASKTDMDARFDVVDARFNAVDARFDAIDARFNTVDAQFQALRGEVARKAEGATLVALEQRVTALERQA